MSNDPALERCKADLVRYAHKLAARGWVANHDGNLSARLPENRFLLSPTGLHKGDITHADLIIVDADGKIVEGTRRPFSEWDLHRAAYDVRPDVAAVIHAHPPTATGFALAGVAVESAALAEPVVTLGRQIPTVSFHLPKSQEGAQAVSQAAHRSDAMLLERHGVLTLGPALETAFLRLELVEHQAKIQLVARQLGGFSLLDENSIATLLTARQAAKLMTPGEQSASAAQVPEVLRNLIAQAVADEVGRR